MNLVIYKIGKTEKYIVFPAPDRLAQVIKQLHLRNFWIFESSKKLDEAVSANIFKVYDSLLAAAQAIRAFDPLSTFAYGSQIPGIE